LGDEIEKQKGEACMVKGEVLTWFWWGNLRERDHMEDPGIAERIILRWVLRKCDGGHGLD
jgi:hypothetical protein